MRKANEIYICIQLHLFSLAKENEIDIFSVLGIPGVILTLENLTCDL